jgi:hypothetical protein
VTRYIPPPLHLKLDKIDLYVNHLETWKPGTKMEHSAVCLSNHEDHV